MNRPIDRYSNLQIALHWTVAVLVIFQFVAHDAMKAAWDAFRQGAAPESGTLLMANVHAVVGIVIFLLALWRIVLRWRVGAPPLPVSDPLPLRILAHVTHIAIYVLIIGLPISGAAAWLGGVVQAGGAHGAASTVLFWLVVLHVTGALVQQFVLRSRIIARMMPARRPV